VNTPVPPRGPKKNNKGRQSGQKQGQNPPARGKAPSRGRQAAYQRQQQQKRLAIGGVALVVVVIAVLVVVAVTRSGSSGTASAAAAADPSVVAQIVKVTPATMAAQAKADTSDHITYPTATGAALLTASGKPKVVYIGADYCPYCGGERWAMAMALSKFGTFSHLEEVTSDSTDTVASIPSFSFYMSSYSSKYLVFDPTETETVSGAKLQSISAANQALFTKYDSGGSIPFLDIGGKWTVVGASYDDSAMQHLSHATVAAAASSGGTKYGADIQAVAGIITSRLCNLTGGQPGSVCKYFPSVIGS
jgi:thiol-disulfide isomerase/thioredoxin